MQTQTKPTSFKADCCPSCGTRHTDNTFLSMSEPIFNDGTATDTDPHYEFTQTHQCAVCNTVYTFESGT